MTFHNANIVHESNIDSLKSCLRIMVDKGTLNPNSEIIQKSMLEYELTSMKSSIIITMIYNTVKSTTCETVSLKELGIHHYDTSILEVVVFQNMTHVTIEYMRCMTDDESWGNKK